MKILLDENLPHRLRPLLIGHDVFTVAFMKWNGVENGELFTSAAADGFGVVITKDTGMPYEQNTQAKRSKCADGLPPASGWGSDRSARLKILS